jgi:hypothetical protein
MLQYATVFFAKFFCKLNRPIIYMCGVRETRWPALLSYVSDLSFLKKKKPYLNYPSVILILFSSVVRFLFPLLVCDTIAG